VLLAEMLINCSFTIVQIRVAIRWTVKSFAGMTITLGTESNKAAAAEVARLARLADIPTRLGT
jgi:hypothetical protein